MDTERRATAYHEAGHAVAAMLLLQVPSEVSIEPDDNTRGRVYGLTEWLHFARIQADRGETDAAQRLADCQAFVCAAGQVATEAVFGIGNASTRHGIDDDIAMEALELAYGSGEAIYRYDEILSDTGLIFGDADVLAAVELVAGELTGRLALEDGDCTWKQVRKLLRSAERQTYAELVKLFKRRERARHKNGAGLPVG